jgi:hypothetical protein
MSYLWVENKRMALFQRRIFYPFFGKQKPWRTAQAFWILGEKNEKLFMISPRIFHTQRSPAWNPDRVC